MLSTSSKQSNPYNLIFPKISSLAKTTSHRQSTTFRRRQSATRGYYLHPSVISATAKRCCLPMRRQVAQQHCCLLAHAIQHQASCTHT